MELKTIVEKQNQATVHILSDSLGRAFIILSEMAYASRQGNLIAELDLLEETYKNILKYSFGYASDPEREKIYNNLKRKLIELTDDIAGSLFENSNEWFASIKKIDESFFRLNEEEKSALIDEMAVEKEFSALLSDVDASSEESPESVEKYNKSLQKVFDILWLSNNYSEGEKILAMRLFETRHIPWHDKSLVVSSITLSLIRHFDISKVEILFKIYDMGEEQVWHRALVGIVWALLIYQDRLDLYSEITNRIKAVPDNKEFARRVEQIIIQIIKAQETEKVTEKIQKEIIPEVMKLRPEIEEKLKLDELIGKQTFEEKNPDWEQFFGDSPDVYKKLEEFSMMQLDGSDVFMGAFSMLKRFGFFEGFVNWFLPFYKEHPEIKKSISGVDEKFNWNDFFESMEQAPVMCNSDKYSFCFNIGFMPEMQKSMMLELFSMELKSMKEVSEEDNKHNQQAKEKTIFTQYIQDLYRFFKLHPRRKNFYDIFSIQLDVNHSTFLSLVFDKNNVRQVGEFYFQKNYYSQALSIFTQAQFENQTYEIVEKIGFCHQKLGQYAEAIEYYKKAEIFKVNQVWLLKKLGYCYRRIGQFDTAIEYYRKVENVEPDNLDILAFLGQLHIDKEDYETALKYYFKVEYLKPDLVKVQRPIAWCSFILKRPEQALKYFNKIVSTEGLRQDHLNMGHCHWALNNLTEAIESYRASFRTSGNDVNWMHETMHKDAVYLTNYGIDMLEISLMIDYITFTT